MSVLITGGAGYIGSHMAHHLVEAGERASSFSTISAPAWNKTCRAALTFVRGDIADQALVSKIIENAQDRFRDPFRRIGGGAGVGGKAAGLLCQQHVGRPHPDRDLRPPRCAEFHFFLDRRGLWHAAQSSRSPKTAPPCPDSPYGRSKLMTEWMLQDTAAAHAHQVRHPALFQCRRRRS